MAKIGVQMMMLKKKVEEEGVFNVLKKCQEIGFNSFEISQIDMTEENVSEMKRAIKELNIEIASLSTALVNERPEMMKIDDLETNYDKLLSDCRELDVKFIRIGALPFSYMGKEEMFYKFAEDMNKYGDQLKKDGLKLFYHNHHFEFQKFNGKTGLDILSENTDPEALGFELDVHWVHRGGMDPVEVIKQLKGRVEVIHLKDYRIKAPEELKDFADFYGMIEFSEIGEGNLDFNKIIDTALDCDVEYMLIEQDDTYGVDPYVSLQTSYDNLVKIGYKDLF